MTTQQFIAKSVATKRSGKCSSVFSTGNAIYSYGYHYPLLINVNDKWILNANGYSRSTAKHISWARPFADFVTHTTPKCPFTPKDLASHSREEYGNLAEKIARLSKRATKKRLLLEEKMENEKAIVNFLSIVPII